MRANKSTCATACRPQRNGTRVSIRAHSLSTPMFYVGHCMLCISIGCSMLSTTLRGVRPNASVPLHVQLYAIVYGACCAHVQRMLQLCWSGVSCCMPHAAGCMLHAGPSSCSRGLVGRSYFPLIRAPTQPRSHSAPFPVWPAPISARSHLALLPSSPAPTYPRSQLARSHSALSPLRLLPLKPVPS